MFVSVCLCLRCVSVPLCEHVCVHVCVCAMSGVKLCVAMCVSQLRCDQLRTQSLPSVTNCTWYTH